MNLPLPLVMARRIAGARESPERLVANRVAMLPDQLNGAAQRLPALAVFSAPLADAPCSPCDSSGRACDAPCDDEAEEAEEDELATALMALPASKGVQHEAVAGQRPRNRGGRSKGASWAWAHDGCGAERKGVRARGGESLGHGSWRASRLSSHPTRRFQACRRRWRTCARASTCRCGWRRSAAGWGRRRRGSAAAPESRLSLTFPSRSSSCSAASWGSSGGRTAS